jgi:hypothetical protein
MGFGQAEDSRPSPHTLHSGRLFAGGERRLELLLGHVGELLPGPSVECVADDAVIADVAAMTPKKTREQVSARLDPDVLEVVQQVAEVERRPISNLVRNIVSDWAKTARVTTRRRHERSDRRRPAPWIFRFDTGAELGDALDLIRVPVVLAAVVFAPSAPSSRETALNPRAAPRTH